MVVSSQPLLSHVQYVENLKLKKCAGISATKRWMMLPTPADGQGVECGLMLTGIKQCGVMGQNHNPTLEAKKSCSSLWKCRDLLVLAPSRQDRNKAPYAELEPKPFWQPMS